MLSVAKAPRTSRVWAVGRPGNVESLCRLRRRDAMGPRQEAGGSTIDSKLTSERSSSDEVSSSKASMLPVSLQTSVEAVDKAADAGLSGNTKTFGARSEE